MAVKENTMKEIAILGFGSRGQMFAKLLSKDARARLYAVAEPAEAVREQAKQLGVPADRLFRDADEFFAQGKLCDAVIISTQDAQHYDMTMKALDLGYDICLEKPAATTMEECVAIRDKANALGRKVMLTHVLRYAPFYRYVKKLIASGELGDIVHIDMKENIAYWHFALSYVRGPWRNAANSTPSIIAKCCHDLDLAKWLMNKKCERVSSFGKLFYYKPENAPAGSAEYCADCDSKVREECPYDAYKVYPQRMSQMVVGGMARLKGRDIYEILDGKQDVVSRCIFRSGNDVADTQTVEMQFEGGGTVHLTMTAFSKDCYRTIGVHGTKGEAFGNLDEAKLEVNIFGKSAKTVDVNAAYNEAGVALTGGHGGGDTYLLQDFIDYLTTDAPSLTRTTIDDSIESHVIGFAAEESRLQNGKCVEIDR